MSKRTLCSCHWSHQVSYMRHVWNKIFFAIIRVMVVMNQILLTSPFIYLKNSQEDFTSSAPKKAAAFARMGCPVKLALKWKFRTQRLVTAAAIIISTFYTIISPFLVQEIADLYKSTRRHQDDIFVTIVKFIVTTEALCALLIMATNIWHRENIVNVLNALHEIICKFKLIEDNLIEFKMFLALVLATAVITCDVLANIPIPLSLLSRSSTKNIVAVLFSQYLYTLQRLFQLSMFTFILLFLLCSRQLEKELQRSLIISNDLLMSQLMNLQDALQEIMTSFRKTFQFGLVLVILCNYVTILCNFYAMADYYATVHIIYSSFYLTILGVAVELYSLILVAYLCDRSQRRVKDLFLQREELFCEKSSNPLSIVVMDVLWPQLNEFQLLGLFTLNNKFALFLFTYSINFILIILEFEVNRARQQELTNEMAQ